MNSVLQAPPGAACDGVAPARRPDARPELPASGRGPVSGACGAAALTTVWLWRWPEQAWRSGLTLVLGTSLWLVQTAAQAAEAVTIAGTPHVRLADWAREKGLTVNWVRPDKVLQLGRSGVRMVLNVNSREAEVNSVRVWLLFPAIQYQGRMYLSQLDVKTTLEPLLSPPRQASGARIRTICLDPGHGGADPGHQTGSRQEKACTLLLAEELRQQLVQAGFRVTLTRTRDTAVDLSARTKLANSRKADLFLSLHFNGTDGGRDSVQGTEVYCLTPAGASSTNARGNGGDTRATAGNAMDAKNLLLAYHVQKALVQGLRAEDRGVRRARFAVLREAAMPAALIEAGFMSHPVEGRKILSASHRRAIAKAIVSGVQAYRRAVGG